MASVWRATTRRRSTSWREPAALGDRLNEFVSGLQPVEPCVWIETLRAFKARMSKPIRVASSTAFTSRLLTSASVRKAPMISVPLWVISGRVFFGRWSARPQSPARATLALLRPPARSMRKTTSWTVPSRGWIEKPIWSPFFGFVHVGLRPWRQFFAAVFVDLEQHAVLRHVGVEPCALGGDERFPVDGEPIVLVALGEQVFLPDDAECRALVFAKLGVSGEEAGLVERLGEPPPEDALALLGFELLPDGSLILARGGGDRAKLLLSWHVARADLIEDGGMDSRKQPQLTDLADGNGERGGDGLFGPVLGGEAFDGAPEVDRGHGRAHDVFAHRPHLVALVGVFDQDVDLGEADLMAMRTRRAP